MKPKFNPGREVMTAGVAEWLNEGQSNLEFAADLRYVKLIDCLRRHLEGDWGDVCLEDKASNDLALKAGYRLLSAYTIDDRKIWIITEADRSSTTILFPEEY